MAVPMALNQQKIGGYTAAQLPTLNTQQQGLQNQSIQQLLSMLGQGGGGFAPIAQQARQQFQQQTVPGLAERFTSLGSGAQRSSAFQGALGQAASGLETNLGALQSQYNLGQQGLLSQLASRPSFENLFAPPQQKPQGLANLLGGLGTGLGYAGPTALASYLGSTAAPAAAAGTAAAGAGGLAALGPIGLGIGGIAGLIALLSYLNQNQGEQ